MNVKIKQNKNTSAVRVATATMAVFVLLFSLCVPAFAYTETPMVDISSFELQPIPYLASPTADITSLGNGGKIYHTSDFRLQSSVSCPVSDLDVFVFSVGKYFYFVSGFDTLSVSQVLYNGGAGTKYSVVSFVYQSQPSTSKGYDDVNGLYYISYLNNTQGLYFDTPSYSSLDAGLSAVKSYIDSSSVSAHSLNTTLPAGNAIIIDVSGNNAEVLSLSSSSALRHKDNWSDGNQMMGYFSSAPTSLSSPFDGTHSITWRGVGSPNLFGGYNTWNTTAPLLPTGNYLVIVNPAYPNDNPDSITSNQASNGAISISCGYCRSAQIVPLSSSWSNGSIVSSSGNLRLDGEYDPNTDSWTFNNSVTGQPQNPVSGGLTDVDAEHITINDWLQNISHQIGSFFSGAIGAVSTLVSAGSDFIHSLSGLYAWLPSPVFTVLSSALILVITIGVIKVFI